MKNLYLSILSVGFLYVMNCASAKTNELSVAWKLASDAYKSEDHSKLLGILKIIEKVVEPTSPDLCRSRELQAAVFSSLCLPDTAKKLVAQIDLSKCDQKTHDRFQELLEYAQNSNQKSDTKTSFSLVNKLVHSRQWPVSSSQSLDTLNNVYFKFPADCSKENAKSLVFKVSAEKPVSSFRNELNVYAPVGLQENAKICDEARAKSSDSKIESIISEVSSDTSQELMNSLKYQTYLSWGDCYLANRQFSEAHNEFEKAFVSTQQIEKRLFIEHRLNWLALNRSTQEKMARLRLLSSLVLKTEESSPLKKILVADLFELASESIDSNHLSLEPLDFLMNFINVEKPADETIRLISRLISKSNLNGSLFRALSQWSAANNLGLLFYRATVLARLNSDGKVTTDAKSSCEALSWIQYSLPNLIADSGELVDPLRKDASTCAAYTPYITKVLKLREQVWDLLPVDLKSNELFSETATYLAITKDNLKTCQFLNRNIKALSESADDRIRQLSIELCAPFAAKYPLLFEGIVVATRPRLLTRIQNEDLTEKSPYWILKSIEYGLASKQHSHPDAVELALAIIQKEKDDDQKVFTYSAIDRILNTNLDPAASIALRAKYPEMKDVLNLVEVSNDFDLFLGGVVDSYLGREILLGIQSLRSASQFKDDVSSCFADKKIEESIECAQKVLAPLSQVRVVALGACEAISKNVGEKCEDYLKASNTQVAKVIHSALLVRLNSSELAKDDYLYLKREFQKYLKVTL